MKIHLSFIATALIALLSVVDAAVALPDPCYIQGRDLFRAERSFSAAENRLSQAQDRLSRLQDQISSRQYGYQAQIAQAQANAAAASAISAGVVGRCVIRGFFGFGFLNCATGSMTSRIGAQARARAMVNAAIGRSNAYNTYAQGALYREGSRVTMAQEEYNSQTTLYQNAQAVYDQCRAAHPSK